MADAVVPFDEEENIKIKSKIKPMEIDNGKENVNKYISISTFFNTLRRIRTSRTLWLLLPFMVMVEIALNISMLVVPPDHDVHFARYCAMCGIDPGTNIQDFFTTNSYTSDEIKAWNSCIADEVLTTSGESFQAFTLNYLATLLGHILTIYALLAATDSVLTDVDDIEGTVIQTFGYLVLLADIIVEVVVLGGIELKDTEHFDRHEVCDHVVVHSIHQHKKDLLAAGFFVMTFRVCVSAVVTLCYIYNTPVYKGKEKSYSE